MTRDQYEAEARVIYDRQDTFHAEAGHVLRGRIGIAFGSEVFWTGSYCLPGDDLAAYGARVGFATELARRWNAGRLALQEKNNG